MVALANGIEILIGGGEDGWARNEVFFACTSILVFYSEQLQRGHLVAFS
jgi:hypothetical protein